MKLTKFANIHKILTRITNMMNIHDTVHQSKKDYKHVLSLPRGKIH